MTGVNYYGRMRQGYIKAATALRKKKLPITDANLGRKLHKRRNTVREYLRRNTDVAGSIGRKPEKPMHGMTDYVNVISGILEREGRVGYAGVAVALGIKRPAAFRFLRKCRDSIEHAIPRAIWIEEKRGGRVCHYIALRPLFDRRQKIGVIYFDAHSRRMALTSVNFVEYVRLWDNGLLKFQWEKTPRPVHLPTREEAVALI